MVGVTLFQDPATEPRVVAALVWAEGMASLEGSSLALSDEIGRTTAECATIVPTATRDAVRAMLRYGSYKPSGRGKPASEFLLRAAISGEFPRINAPVDVNNVVSLASGLPGSVFDAGLTGPRLCLRYGVVGESYVFNPSGQSIDLEDLLVVCRDTLGRWEPCGNPVKDAMATKVRGETNDVAGVLYSPRVLGHAFAERWASRYAELLERCCRPRRVGYSLAVAS
jgi:DNA/RNA-binding domain of Phe-tRNA-synthetase-like protein